MGSEEARQLAEVKEAHLLAEWSFLERKLAGVLAEANRLAADRDRLTKERDEALGAAECSSECEKRRA